MICLNPSHRTQVLEDGCQIQPPARKAKFEHVTEWCAEYEHEAKENETKQAVVVAGLVLRQTEQRLNVFFLVLISGSLRPEPNEMTAWKRTRSTTRPAGER